MLRLLSKMLSILRNNIHFFSITIFGTSKCNIQWRFPLIKPPNLIEIKPWHHLYFYLYEKIVMGISHNVKIDDRYTNIDQWSIIGDNYLLNVFTDYNYSNSLYFKNMLDKSKDLNKIISYIYKLQFFHL